ncbi:hypothetical protein [Chloroflexus sp.]
MSAREALRRYRRRRSAEVDTYFLKEGLGLTNVRGQRFEAMDR